MNKKKDPMIVRYDTQMKQKDKRPLWIFLGILAIIIKVVTEMNPYAVEGIYSNTIFKGIRFILDNTIGRLGFAFIFIAVPFMLFKIFMVYMKSLRPDRSCLGRVFNFLYSTFASVMWIIFWFTFLWGLNYNRPSVKDSLDLNHNNVEVSSDYLKQELIFRDSILENIRAKIVRAQESITEKNLPDNLEDLVRKDLMNAMRELGYDISGNVRIRQLPKGSLLRIGTAGFYFPFTGEGHIDKALHPLQKPFTMVHELAHGYGIGDEGECNFLAYVACRNSSDPIIRYSGLLSFWRYLAIDYKKNRSRIEDYSNYRKNLPQGILTDLNEINENLAKYPDIFPTLRDNTYDAYLKAQGVDEGMDSYGTVVALVLAWENKNR